MIRKSPTTKSTKVNSKSKYNETQKYPWQLANEHIASQWRKQFTRLQQAINQQATKRLESENYLLSLIKHLQQTKKSKIPLNLEILGLNRLKSPLKIKKSFEESECVLSIHKNLLTEAKSQKNEQFEINQLKEKKIENELERIGEKMIVVDSLNQKIQAFQGQINQLKRNNSQLEDQISHQMNKLRSQNQKVKSRVYLELKDDLQSFSSEIKTTIFKIAEKLNQRIQINATETQSNLNQCFKKLQCISDSTTFTLSSLEQQVKTTSESIIEAKEAIQFSLNGQKGMKVFQESTLSDNWNPQSILSTQKRPNEVLQALEFVKKRVDSFQRRIDLLYHDYLSRPFHRV